MSDYTPTTGEVCAAWVASYRWPDGSPLRGRDEKSQDEFYRWLSEHDSCIKEQQA